MERTRHPLSSTLTALAALLLSLALAAGVLTGCSDQQDDSTANDQDAPTDQQADQPSFEPHGSTFEKAETVTANTNLSGDLTDIAVSEWVKNPNEEDVVDDVSTLQAITPDDDSITFTQDGSNLQWTTGGKDVHYTGITDQELPFAIHIDYTLDGQAVDPSALKDATGTLEIHVTYENNADATVSVNGASQDVKQPYLMATMISFDPEHAKNIQVDNGQVMDQDSTLMALGVAMPGLANTLGLEDEIDLPEELTITADVTGFEMPNVTTIVTNQALSAIGDDTTSDIDSTIDDVFGQMSSIQEATDKLSQGTDTLSQALSTISAGQEKLNAAFPNATNGLTQLQGATSGIAEGLGTTQTQAQAVSDAQAQALETLQGIDTEQMTDEQKASIDQAISELQTAQESSDTVTQGLTASQAQAQQVAAGLGKASEGLEQVQAGYAQLGEATTKVSAAADQLSTATSTMSEGIKSALSEAQNGINEKLDLIDTLKDLVDSEGAFCGSPDEMPSNTMFVVTAKADA